MNDDVRAALGLRPVREVPSQVEAIVTTCMRGRIDYRALVLLTGCDRSTLRQIIRALRKEGRIRA